MGSTTLIIGESGTGKSTSLKNLDPQETFIINVLNKPLPFKGFKNKYIQTEGGNYFSTDSAPIILKIIEKINKERSAIKTLIIDDFQYIMANEFMRRASEKGYNKFTEIGCNAWSIVNLLLRGRDDLDSFILSHSETDGEGKSKCKTIGKMLDDKITLEGMFTIVLHSLIIDGQYKFLTQNDGVHVAKSPLSLFEERFIDNDLKKIKDKMQNYFENDDINQ